MFVTLVPENGEIEHIVTGEEAIGPEQIAYWGVGCGHKFSSEKIPLDDLLEYDSIVKDETPKKKEFCQNCLDRLQGDNTGMMWST